MTGLEVGTLAVSVVVGLGSGLGAALVTAWTQRKVFDAERAGQRDNALWRYEMALRDKGSYLSLQGASGGAAGSRKAGPSVHEARVEAYRHLHTLPSKLARDLRDPDPFVQTSGEAGAHYEWLADELHKALLTMSGKRTTWRRDRSREDPFVHG